MAHSTITLLLATLAILASAHALTPDNFIANGDTCKASGTSAGPTAASQACQYARARCQGGLMSSAPTSIGAVTLSQCSNM